LGRSWEKFEKFGVSGAKAERQAEGDISGGGAGKGEESDELGITGK